MDITGIYNLFIQLGIGAFGMYLMYRIILYVLKNHFRPLMNQIEKQTKAIEKLAIRIERIDVKINGISKKIDDIVNGDD